MPKFAFLSKAANARPTTREEHKYSNVEVNKPGLTELTVATVRSKVKLAISIIKLKTKSFSNFCFIFIIH